MRRLEFIGGFGAACGVRLVISARARPVAAYISKNMEGKLCG